MALIPASEALDQVTAINSREAARLLQEGNGKPQLAFAKDVKQSLLFQYDWAELLSAAPIALSLIGSCYVAATAPKAQGISLKDAEPTGGFKYISHSELKACLVQVSDTGRMAFIVAEKNMELISATSTSLGRNMSTIMSYLPELPHRGAELAINNKLELLKSGSDDCLKYAQEIEAEFVKWLSLVCELHQVTVAKKGQTSNEQQDIGAQMQTYSFEEKLTATNLEHVEEAAKTMKDEMLQSRHLFEKAANAIPGPWESMFIDLVGSINNSVTAVIGLGLPVIMKAAGSVAGMVRGKGKKVGDGGSNTQKKSTVGSSPLSDPALPLAIPTLEAIIILTTLLGVGTDEDIQWHDLHPDGDGKSALILAKVMLEQQLPKVKQSDGRIGAELEMAITQCLEVVSTVQSAVSKEKQLMATAPDQATVKEWIQTVRGAKDKVTKLSTAAMSLPGSAPGAPPLLNARPASHAMKNSSAANAALIAASERLQMTQAAYTASQEIYNKAAEHTVEVGSKLTEIKANLARLKAQDVTMTDIKRILIQCIDTLVDMKEQITNLVRFFAALSAIVEHVVKFNVKDLVQQADSARELLVANVSLLDVSRQELYTTILMCQAYFSVFSSIAKMYNEVSMKHIMPGLRLCDELSKSTDDPEAIDNRTGELTAYSDAAQKHVRELISQAQQNVMDSLDGRTQRIEQDVQALPELPVSSAAAIAEGKRMVTEAAQEQIRSSGPFSVTIEDVSISLEELEI